MLMHFPVDPVMSVFSGVRVGSHRNECLLLMWVFRLWCMSKTRTTSKGPVGDRCVTVNLEPTRTSTFLKKQQQADSDLKVINRWKEAGDKRKNHCRKMCCLRVVLRRPCGHSGTGRQVPFRWVLRIHREGNVVPLQSSMKWELTWNDSRLTFLAHCQNPRGRKRLCWWLVTISLNGLRLVTQYQTRRPSLLLRSYSERVYLSFRCT